MIIYSKDIYSSNFKHKRIISLVPSITETLFYLGLGNNIVGVTNWCKYPEHEIKQITKIGGVKGFDKDIISELKPDIIFAVKEENDKEEIKSVAREYNVFVATVENFEDSTKLINDIGLLTKTSSKAKYLSSQIEREFNNIPDFEGKTCAYFVWNKPMMVVGANTFIDSVLQKCNFNNVFSGENSYPIVEFKDITLKNPEVIFLCSEPFEFKEKHRVEYQTKFPSSKIILINAEMFTWYGSHLLETRNYLNELSEKLLNY